MHPISPPLHAPILRVRPRPTRSYLTKRLLDLRFNTDTQPALGPFPVQHLHPRPVRLTIRAERPAAVRLEPLQPGPRPLQACLPLGAVLVALRRAAVPQAPVALGRTLRALHPVIDDVRAVPPARVRLAADLAPRRRVALQGVPEPTVFGPRPRQHRQE